MDSSHPSNVPQASPQQPGESVSQRFRKVLESAPDAILEVDANGRIVLINAQVEELFRWPREALLGQPIEVLIPGRLRHSHHGHREAYSHQPSTRPMGTGLDLWAVRKDGTEFAVDINLSPVELEGRTHVICIVRDVSERKKAEEQIRTLNQQLENRGKELSDANMKLASRNEEVERISNLKSEFLASMSHELRTPLNAIIGFSDLLMEERTGPLNEKQRRFLGHIQQGAQHLLHLINDVLDLSKIEADRLELRPEQFDVATAIQEVLATVKPLAEAKQILLERPELPAIALTADRVRVKQILFNLLSNAIKFTPEKGMARVDVRLEANFVVIAVTDTGVGISEENQREIFNSFQQFGPTTKGVREGTGLGLAITKRLVELHGGKITLASILGQGSRFECFLPLIGVERNYDAGRPLSPARTAPVILIVEDDPSSGELLASYLESEGYSIATASSGIEAVRKAREIRPDVITLDVLMPLRSGWEALHELKTSPGTTEIPAIIISVMDEKQMAFTLGADEYLVKPVSRDDLVAAVKRYLPKK
ncbi:MAG: ATP-binding protein [Bryobacteraceae bacterium]